VCGEQGYNSARQDRKVENRVQALRREVEHGSISELTQQELMTVQKLL
jgi:hypothetical protein